MARLSSLFVAILTLTPTAYSRHLRASKVFLDGRQVQNEYDYVIIGGGTAGLTVADRLTEDGKTTVLVIEYGVLSASTHIEDGPTEYKADDAQARQRRSPRSQADSETVLYQSWLAR